MCKIQKKKFESVKIFNSTLNRGESTKFIQAEFSFEDYPYSIFIYFPIKNGGLYENKIIVMQKEDANLGYEFALSQNDYLKIKSDFPKIVEMKLEDFYLDKP